MSDNPLVNEFQNEVARYEEERERIEEIVAAHDADLVFEKALNEVEQGVIGDEEFVEVVEDLYTRVLDNASSADLISEHLVSEFRSENKIFAKPQKYTKPENKKLAHWPAEVLFGSELFDTKAYIAYASSVLFVARALRHANQFDRSLSDRCYDMFRGYNFENSSTATTGFDFKSGELILQHV